MSSRRSSSSRAAASQVIKAHGVLDVLVDHAGINGGGPEPLDETTAAGMTAELDTNVVVNVGSGLGSFGRVHDAERAEARVQNLLPYPVATAAVSMLIVQYARFPRGIDWAEGTHDVALVDDSGRLLAERHITSDAAGHKIPGRGNRFEARGWSAGVRARSSGRRAAARCPPSACWGARVRHS